MTRFARHLIACATFAPALSFAQLWVPLEPSASKSLEIDVASIDMISASDGIKTATWRQVSQKDSVLIQTAYFDCQKEKVSLRTATSEAGTPREIVFNFARRTMTREGATVAMRSDVEVMASNYPVATTDIGVVMQRVCQSENTAGLNRFYDEFKAKDCAGNPDHLHCGKLPNTTQALLRQLFTRSSQTMGACAIDPDDAVDFVWAVMAFTTKRCEDNPQKNACHDSTLRSHLVPMGQDLIKADSKEATCPFTRSILKVLASPKQ